MRFLADENFPGDAITALRLLGHDVRWVRTEAPGSGDSSVLNWAQRESRVLLTFDKDFGEMAFRWGLPASSGIVLFRMRICSSSYVAHLCTTLLEIRTDLAGNFTVVEDDRLRITPIPEL